MTTVKVLIVDDEREFVELFIKRFRARKLDVHGVNSGRDAMTFLAENKTDVVVLDVMMPGMDGIETLKEIKKRYPEVEVIMLTGHGSMKTGIEGMSYGAYDYVLKPFKIDDLMDLILKAYERKAFSDGEK